MEEKENSIVFEEISIEDVSAKEDSNQGTTPVQDDVEKENDSENNPQNKGFGQGVGYGVVIGFALATIICTVVFSLLIIYRFRPSEQQATTVQPGSELSLGQAVTDKMNTLLSVIDYYYLYEYDKEEMANKIYDAIMEALNDPYSIYYTEEEYKELKQDTDGTYCGIGVVVSKDADTGEVVVMNPYENCPGAEAGIQEGDIIVAADGLNLADLELEQAVTHIKGDEGTQVVLTIRRGTESFDLTITRRMIDVITVDSEMLEDNIGYIAIAQFDAVTKNQFIKALDELNAQGMESLIIDIRDNPGGRLDTVAAMADYVLPEGLVVYTKDKRGNVQELKSDSACALNVPCVVLINGNSASASEIFAGAMQDYKKATIMGTQSYGKGIVQSILSLKDGSAIKLTVEDYFTPNGNNIHGVGITPDVVVEFDKDAYMADGTDNQFNAAVEYLKEQMN